jgi:hypothetical protein
VVGAPPSEEATPLDVLGPIIGGAPASTEVVAAGAEPLSTLFPRLSVP